MKAKGAKMKGGNMSLYTVYSMKINLIIIDEKWMNRINKSIRVKNYNLEFIY